MGVKKLDTYIYRNLFDNFPLQPNTDDVAAYEYFIDDFISYLAYHIRKPNADYFFYEFIARETMGVGFFEENEYTPTEEQLALYKKEAKKFVKNFMNKWWDRFLARSQVLLWNQKLSEEQQDYVENGTNYVELADEFSEDELYDLLDYVEDELIKRGEYAFVASIAEELVYGCMASYISISEESINTDLGTQEGKISLLSKINQELRKMTANRDHKIVYLMYGGKKPKSSEDYS